MKFLTIASLAFMASGISANIEPKFDASFDGEEFSVSAACRPINGDIVYDCGSDTDAFLISKINLSPAKPVKGGKLTVTLTGTVNEAIPEKSNAHVTAKLGIFTVLNKDYDFCDYIKGDTVKCPIQQGPVNVTKVVEIPSSIPGGKYLIDAVATTPSKKRIIHIQLKLSL